MELYSMDRDSRKAHLLAIINGRKVNLKEEDPKWYKEFYLGMRHIMREIVKLNPDLFELAEKSKKDRNSFNVDGTTVNYVMCRLENQALMTSFKYLTEQGIEVASLVFDGLMIYKKDISPERLKNILTGLIERVKTEMGPEIVFSNREMDEGYEIPTPPQKKAKLDLLLRKGIFPYDWMDSIQKLKETELPPKEAFYSKLNDSDVSDEDYQHAQNVWREFEMKTFKDYLNLYNKTDVLLLADVFENSERSSWKNYSLDPAWYFTAPGLAWDAALKITEVRLELLSDSDLLLMFEKGIRGGISTICNRYGKANSKYMKDFNPEEPSKFISYLNANNLYGWAMSKNLPTHGFEWMNKEELKDWKNQKCILEADLDYPKRLHDYHYDYPLAAENLKIKNVEKLIPNLNSKTKYVLHCENLKQCIDMGLKIRKIYRGINFKSSPWLKKYIDLNTKFRTQGKNYFEKDFFKLMNYSVFGKTMENIRNRVDIKLCNNRESARKLTSKPNFNHCTIFDENLVAIHMKKTKLIFDKPIYLGMCILDLSKTLMYDFHYNYIKPKYGNSAKLLFTDTDSLMYEIQTEDFFKDISEDVNEFVDTSNFPENHPSGMKRVNKKVIGMFKDEAGGEIIQEFVGLRSKLYAYKMHEKEARSPKEEKKCKGIKKSVVKKSISFEDYKRCLLSRNEAMKKKNVIRSRSHPIFTEEINKTALSANDDKRVILQDEIHTLAYGHWRI